MSDTVTHPVGDERPVDPALAVDAAARSVAGVAELYYAARLPARLWRAAVDTGAAYSVVAHHADGVEATVSIGVAGGRIAEVAGQVAARVRDALGDPAARVTVRVSRITASGRA